MLRVNRAGSASRTRANIAPRNSRTPRLAAHDMPYWATKPARPRMKVRPMTATGTIHKRHAAELKAVVEQPFQEQRNQRLGRGADDGAEEGDDEAAPAVREERRDAAESLAAAATRESSWRGIIGAARRPLAARGGERCRCLQSPASTKRRMPAPTLSVILITKNESARIDACLASVAFADEWIVVDSGSSDDTCERARAFGATVIATSDWPGFGAQKQRALDRASGRWVLAIDADERVTPELAREHPGRRRGQRGRPGRLRAGAPVELLWPLDSPRRLVSRPRAAPVPARPGALFERPRARARDRRGAGRPPRRRPAAPDHADPRRRARQDEPLQQRRRGAGGGRRQARRPALGAAARQVGVPALLPAASRFSRWCGRLHAGRLYRRGHLVALPENDRARTLLAKRMGVR